MSKLKAVWSSASLFRRYLIIFFTVISVVSICLTVTLLGFSLDRFHSLERESIRHRMTVAASDMESQIDVMKDVAHSIRSSYS